MNKTLNIEEKTNEVLPAFQVPVAKQNSPKLWGDRILKNWVKKVPFFSAMDYFRRKVYDAQFFDGLVRSLANVLEEWPGALLIDITNRCNAKCVWCPNPDLTNVGAMDMDVYRKIIDDYGSRGGVLTFGTFGEPLMDKHMKKRIEYLKCYPKIHKIEIFTN